MTKTWIALLALGAAAVDHVAAREPRAVRMPMHRAPTSQTSVRKRAAGPQSVTLGNAEVAYLYYVNATVGTPPQQVQLQIDTGSSDVWMFSQQLCQSQQDLCEGGDFNPSSSTSYHQQGQAGAFKIQYVTPNSGVSGDYFTDDFTIGDIQLTDLTMAVATYAQQVNTGIMGIGFADDESIVSEQQGPYPSIIDVMVNESIIPSHSYSLYLDDREALTGAVLFGGYDTAKYTPPLTVLDIQPDSQSGAITSFTVAWSFIGVSAGSSSATTLLSGGDFPIPAVLDSGTSLTVVPQDIFSQLANYFNATYVGEELGYVVPCSNQNLEGTLDFGFGNANGGIIQVPFSELALPFAAGDSPTFPDGSLACSFGLDVVGEDSPVLLGDTFLRSAYVIYDLEAKQIGIAQANFNSTGSNVQTIAAGTNLASILGSSASYATASMVPQTQTASAILPPGLGNVNSASGTISTASSGTGTVLAGVTTTLNVHHLSTGAAGSSKSGGSGGSGSSPTSTPTGAAVSVMRSSSLDMTLCMVTVFALFTSGAAMMVLF